MAIERPRLARAHVTWSCSRRICVIYCRRPARAARLHTYVPTPTVCYKPYNVRNMLYGLFLKVFFVRRTFELAYHVPLGHLTPLWDMMWTKFTIRAQYEDVRHVAFQFLVDLFWWKEDMASPSSVFSPCFHPPFWEYYIKLWTCSFSNSRPTNQSRYYWAITTAYRVWKIVTNDVVIYIGIITLVNMRDKIIAKLIFVTNIKVLFTYSYSKNWILKLI